MGGWCAESNLGNHVHMDTDNRVVKGWEEQVQGGGGQWVKQTSKGDIICDTFKNKVKIVINVLSKVKNIQLRSQSSRKITLKVYRIILSFL